VLFFELIQAAFRSDSQEQQADDVVFPRWNKRTIFIRPSVSIERCNLTRRPSESVPHQPKAAIHRTAS
jgi:hypothetical protein